MPVISLEPDIYWIGVNDRTTDLFEGLWLETMMTYETSEKILFSCDGSGNGCFEKDYK